MIGSFYDDDPKLTEQATLELERLGDEEFTRTVEPYRELVVAAEPLPEQQESGAVAGQSAAELGELFVRTTPLQAAVTVDGVPVGTSPVFIPDLPLGKVVLRAVSEPYVGELTVSVDRTEIIPVTIELRIPSGAIRIDTTLAAIEVFLDDRSVSRGGRKVLEGIEPGRHIVVVRGVDRSGRLVFWENEVTVEPGATTVLQVP
jgi:hypothetical protein